MNRFVLISILFVLILNPTLRADDMANQKLWAAARSGNVVEIENSLKDGAEINAPQPKDYGKTALHLAAERGHTDAVSKLLALKANVKVKINACLSLACPSSFIGVVTGADAVRHRGLRRLASHGAGAAARQEPAGGRRYGRRGPRWRAPRHASGSSTRITRCS